jgi:isoaspartyl peptidase/L-asparaginase-like protein (Ntn-hydrolase superfamily)
MSSHLCGTWSFCADPMMNLLHSSSKAQNFNLSDLVVDIIEKVELNPNQATVGRPGSVPNKNGIFELDAAWMRSKIMIQSFSSSQKEQKEECESEDVVIEGECGAIMALRGFDGAIRLARQVALSCPHSILAGIGAEEFGREQSQICEKIARLSSSLEKEKMEKEEEQENSRHQDTLGITAIRVVKTKDEQEEGGDDDDEEKKKEKTTIEIIAAVSSSGLGRKHPGRIGDSPIFGCGLYSDATIGAVAASGDGDSVSLFPISFVAVEEMKRLIMMTKSKENENHEAKKQFLSLVVDRACQYAIKRFFESPNVKAFVKKSAVKNRLSEGGPLIGLCGVAYFVSDDEIVTVSGGACCSNWSYEFVTSHLKFDEDEKEIEQATIRKY